MSAPEVVIRDFQPGDAGAMVSVFAASVRGIGSKHYARDQVEAWASRAPAPERFVDRAVEARMLVAEVDGRLAAFSDVDATGYIDFLYCRPEQAGRGVADRLVDALEAHARSAGVPELTTNASEAARSFFLRRGFDVVARRDFEIGGVRIHNYAMRKRLTD
ncbi:MAG: GNAT family N-acetyltransferase [Hyphomonadaceae bacterium]